MRLLARALLALWAAAVLAPGAGLCASAGGMAGDVLNSITRSPSAKQAQGQSSGSGGAQKGPSAPAQPVAPVVPGAAPFSDSRSDRPLREIVRPAAQPRAGQAKAAKGGGQQPAPGRHSLALSHDGAERRAVVMVPKAGQGKKGQAPQKLPVLIFLHGAGGSAAQAMRQTGLAERAAAAGFLAVFPEGLGPNGAGGGVGGGASGDGQTWNAWMCCGYARDNRVDDVGFLTALIARLRSEYSADPARIHLAGFSNGAMLASRFVLERPGVAASLVSVAGFLPCDAQQPAGALPVLVIHGAQDKVARFAPTEAKPATGRFCEDYPARAQVEFWVRGMALSPKGKVQDSPRSPSRVEEYGPAKGKVNGQGGGQGGGHGGLVRFVIVKNGGHAWPGGARERYRYCDLPTTGVDATGLVLDFIKRTGGAAATEPDGAQNKAPAKTGRKSAKGAAAQATFR